MKRLANLILLIAAAGTVLAGCMRVVKFETPQIKQDASQLENLSPNELVIR